MFSAFSVLVILAVSGVGMLAAARQPGGMVAYARGAGRAFVVRGVTLLVVFALVNAYIKWHVGY